MSDTDTNNRPFLSEYPDEPETLTLRDPINPYSKYNNQDRFWNVAYRYYATGDSDCCMTRVHPGRRGISRTLPAYQGRVRT